MKKWIIIILIVASLLMIAGYFAKKQFDKAMKYCYNYNIKRSKVNKISQSLIDIDFAVDFKNNSDIDAQIDGYSFDVLLNDNKISEVKSSSKVNIKANAFTTIMIPIKIDLGGMNGISLPNILTYLATDRSKIIIKIKGSVSGGALGIKLTNMPVELSMSLKEIMTPSKEPSTECK